MLNFLVFGRKNEQLIGIFETVLKVFDENAIENLIFNYYFFEKFEAKNRAV